MTKPGDSAPSNQISWKRLYVGVSSLWPRDSNEIVGPYCVMIVESFTDESTMGNAGTVVSTFHLPARFGWPTRFGAGGPTTVLANAVVSAAAGAAVVACSMTVLRGSVLASTSGAGSRPIAGCGIATRGCGARRADKSRTCGRGASITGARVATWSDANGQTIASATVVVI